MSKINQLYVGSKPLISKQQLNGSNQIKKRAKFVLYLLPCIPPASPVQLSFISVSQVESEVINRSKTFQASCFRVVILSVSLKQSHCLESYFKDNVSMLSPPWCVKIVEEGGAAVNNLLNVVLTVELYLYDYGLTAITYLNQNLSSYGSLREMCDSDSGDNHDISSF